ncbi:MAG: DUF7668 domain-containing protein [Cetobacterium sp.]
MLSNKMIEYWLKRIVQDLVDKNYEQMKDNGFIFERVDLEALKEEIDYYPGDMTMPPEEQFKNFDRYDYTVPGDEVASVEFDLWYDGKKSDLMLSVDFIKDGKGGYYGRLYDVHVP